MKKTVGNPIMLLLICVLSLALFTVRATACPDPECYDNDDCPDCYKCVNGECEQYGNCWAGCEDCTKCEDCHCHYQCEDCYYCDKEEDKCKCRKLNLYCLHDFYCCVYVGEQVGISSGLSSRVCPGENIHWTASGGATPDEGYGSIFVTTWSTPGTKTVYANTPCDSNSITVNVCSKLECETCISGVCDVIQKYCPSASGGCLTGGACGAGNFHKELQIRSSYPKCIDGVPCDKLYTCILLKAYSNEDCTIGLLVYCHIDGYGCDPEVGT